MIQRLLCLVCLENSVLIHLDLRDNQIFNLKQINSLDHLASLDKLFFQSKPKSRKGNPICHKEVCLRFAKSSFLALLKPQKKGLSIYHC